MHNGHPASLLCFACHHWEDAAGRLPASTPNGRKSFPGEDEYSIGIYHQNAGMILTQKTQRAACVNAARCISHCNVLQRHMHRHA